MHDLHEADKILKLSIEHAKKNKLTRIDKIVISLGEVMEHGQEINPENLIFNLKQLAKNSIAKSAEIVVKKNNFNTWELLEIEGS